MSGSDVLRVILHDEDRHPRPELRVAQGVDNLTESEVVVGDHGLGCRSPRRGSVGVIGRKLAQARPNRGEAASWVFNNLGASAFAQPTTFVGSGGRVLIRF